MALRHLISPLDLTEEETTRILDLADRIGTHKEAYAHLAEGKQLATLFMSQAPEPDCPLNLPC